MESNDQQQTPLLRVGDAIADDNSLLELGYKQELSRSLSAVANFAVTFSIISVLTGLTTVFNMGLTYDGPVTMVYGWPVIGIMTMIVGLSMAESCPAFPTSAGLYFWSAKLCGRSRWGLSLLGLLAGTLPNFFGFYLF